MNIFQKDSSEFEGLVNEIVTKKIFTNQDISYTNGNSESKLCTLSNYIKEFFSILEIERYSVKYDLNGRQQLN